MTGRSKLELIYERKISIRQLFLCSDSDKAWVHTSCFSVGDSRSVSIKLLAAFHQSHSIRCTRVVNPSKDLTVFQISGTCVYQLCFSLKSNACILYLTCYCYIYRTNKIISPERLHKKFYFLNLCDTMQHISMYATKTVVCVSWTSSHSFALFFYLQILNDGSSIRLEALCISNLELLWIYSGAHVHVYYKRNSRINTDWW